MGIVVSFDRKKIKNRLISQRQAGGREGAARVAPVKQGGRCPVRLSGPLGLSLALSLGLPGAAWAAGVPTLEEVQVSANQEDLAGVADSASVGTVTAAQLANRPLLRPAEALETVPGLIVTQHAGDGKANQYFLRGFNLDHGTDFAAYVDDVPINLPTHAHGQGYLDLNFLIPELVDRIRYKKGTYFADEGDFSAAGAAHIDYARSLPDNFASLGVGENGYQRVLVAGSRAAGDGNLLGAIEGYHYDGPWTVPEDNRKINALLRYSQGSRDQGFALTAQIYDAAWTSTDQLAKRAVDEGLVGRYGSLDPSDGGKTHRYSLAGQWASQRDDGVQTRANVYWVDYGLNLFSNFTYALDNPVQGDQFEQVDRRHVMGFGLNQSRLTRWAGVDHQITYGVQGRYDDIGNVGLYRTEDRSRLATVSQDAVQQGSVGLFLEAASQWTPWFRTVAGLRQDFYHFRVNANVAANSGSASDHITSPKLSFIFGPFGHTEYYLNLGQGFHSNDARGATIRVDPADGVTPQSRVTPLVKARGQEIGVRTVPLAGWQTSLALWRLDLDSELVFSGDAGTTEASRPSHRTGVEWGNFWKPRNWLTVDGDISWSRARFTDGDPVGDRIPGAVERTASLGMTVSDLGRWQGGLRFRYFGPRPLIEDNSVRSASSFLTNLNLGYKLAPKTTLALEVLNLFDRKVSDIDYYYASRLRTEAGAVDDIHFHPAEPRTARVILTLHF